MADTRRGFHSLEKKIHDLEEKDRAAAARESKGERGKGRMEEQPEAERRTPPPAHDE